MLEKRLNEYLIRQEIEETLEMNGIRSKTTSLVGDDINPTCICDFCHQELQSKTYAGPDGETRKIPHSFVPCGCPEAIANEERYRLAYQEEYNRLSAIAKRQRVEELLEKSKMPARWKIRTFECFTVNESNEGAYNTAKQYADDFDPTKGEGLLFFGPVGIGKTHLAAAIAMALIEREYSVVFGTIHTLLSRIRYSYSDDKESEQELFETYTSCDLLIIDDLGKEKVSDWVEQTVFDIINARYDDNKPVIITTNLSLKAIRSKYKENGDALVDRIIEMCSGVRCEGDSWRKKVLV